MARKMILIEDEDDLRTLLEEYLMDHGVEVAAFDSADRALPYWRAHAEKINLILSDIRLPGSMDGIDFARQVRASPGHQPPIVMISGFEPPPRAVLEKMGITEFISKPFRISELSRLCLQKLKQDAPN